MLLYNVNFRDNTDPLMFPKIPESAGKDEDKSVKRICLSSSIDGCIQAIGPCGRDLYIGSKFVVKSADTSTMNKSALISPRNLWLSSMVPDALENSEYWYTDKLRMKIQTVQVLNFEFSYDIAWSCIKVQDMRNLCSKFGIQARLGESTQVLYDNAQSQLVRDKRFDDLDNLYEEVVALPWAQKLTISNLKLKYL